MACIRRVENSRTDPDFVVYQTSEEAHKQDLSDSYEIGYDDGVTKRNIETAKNLLKQSLPIQSISLATSLSMEEIEKLQ